MRTRLFLLCLMLLTLSCKKRANPVIPQVEKSAEQVETVSQIPPIIKELIKFADVSPSDGMDTDQAFLFMEISEDGDLHEVDMERAISLYKKLMKRSPAAAFPIFEVKGTETVILPVQGKGYGGPIWAKILVDRTTLEINKIAFEHKAESEGYGAAITGSLFENQFVGKKIDLEKAAFGLAGQIEGSRGEGTVIEGISGATMTSEAAVDMVNNGIKKYRKYLNKKP